MQLREAGQAMKAEAQTTKPASNKERSATMAKLEAAIGWDIVPGHPSTLQWKRDTSYKVRLRSPTPPTKNQLQGCLRWASHVTTSLPSPPSALPPVI